MSLFNKLKGAGMWQALQVIALVATQFIYIGFMARLLSKADFGLIALAGSFIGIGTIFSEGGMRAALIQRQNITQKHMNAALQGSILMGVFAYALLFFFSKSIAAFFNQPALNLMLKVISIEVILNSISGISSGLLQKKFQFKKTSVVTISATIVGYAIGIILGFKGFGVWSLVAANLIASLICVTVFFYLAPLEFSFKIHVKEWKELFSFGFGVILLKISNYMGQRGINLVLGKIFTADLLGLFERAYRIKSLPSTYLGQILDTIMFPAMSEIQDENERLFRMYQQSLGMVNSILMPVAVYFIFFTHEIVLILLGDKWLEAVIPLQIMFAVLPFASSGRMADSVIRAKGLIYNNAIRKYIYVIILITATSLGAINYGVIGAAVGVSFSYFFDYIIMLYLVKNTFKKNRRDIFIAPALSGIKLSGFILLLLIIFTTLFGSWGKSRIDFFIIITVLTTSTIALLGWRRPSFLGHYIADTIIKLKKQK